MLGNRDDGIAFSVAKICMIFSEALPPFRVVFLSTEHEYTL